MAFQSFTPIEYLMIDVANNWGHDKDDWDDRISWFKQNEPDLETMVEQAAEPALYYAGVQAYRRAVQGLPIGYPISLDATSSGAQLLAVMIGCRKSAKLCNVLDVGSRMDLYTIQYKAMCDLVTMPKKITRKECKQAVMTAYFGSTRQPKSTFGEGEILEAFYKVMEENTPGIWELNQALLGLWRADAYSHDWVMPDNFHVHVKVMDDHAEKVDFLGHSYTVHSEINQPTTSGLSIPANLVHSLDGMVVREISRRCTFDHHRKVEVMELCIDAPTHTDEDRLYGSKDAKMIRTLLNRYEASGFLSARIIDHIDSSTIQLLDAAQRTAVWDLVASMPERSFPVLSVHDCFRVHPNNANDLRRQYNQILHEIANSKILESLATQIAGEPVIVTRHGSFGNDILEANYALS
jgi:hypothetical protein